MDCIPTTSTGPSGEAEGAAEVEPTSPRGAERGRGRGRGFRGGRGRGREGGRGRGGGRPPRTSSVSQENPPKSSESDTKPADVVTPAPSKVEGQVATE